MKLTLFFILIVLLAADKVCSVNIQLSHRLRSHQKSRYTLAVMDLHKRLENVEAEMNDIKKELFPDNDSYLAFKEKAMNMEGFKGLHVPSEMVLTRRRSVYVKPRGILREASESHFHRNLNIHKEEDFQIIVSIMGKTPKQRTEADVHDLKDAFKDIKYFDNLRAELGDQALMNCFKELTHETIAKRAPVFSLGDMGRKFYIILKGEVFVLLKRQGMNRTEEKKPVAAKVEEDKQKQPDPGSSDESLDDEEGNDSGKKEGEGGVNWGLMKSLMKFKRQMKKANTSHPITVETKPGGMSKRFTKISLKSIGNLQLKDSEVNKFLATLSDQEFIELTYPEMFVVRTLSTGDSFGELALRQNIPRTATILCKVDTHFGVLAREEFQRILSEHYNNIYNKNLEFLQSFPIFQTWNQGSLEQIFHQLKKEVYRRSQIIYKDGEKANYLYFIFDGEVEISQIHQKSLEAMKDQLSKLDFLNMEKKQRNLVSRTLTKNFMEERVRISLLSKGQMFGERELLENKSRETIAKVVSSHVTLYSMHRDKFFSFVRNPRSLKCLEDMNRKKSEYHTEKLEKDFHLNESLRQRKQINLEKLKKLAVPLETSTESYFFPQINNAQTLTQFSARGEKDKGKLALTPKEQLSGGKREINLRATTDFNLKTEESGGKSPENSNFRFETNVRSFKAEDHDRNVIIECSHQSKMILNFDRIYNKIREDFDSRAMESLSKVKKPEGYDLLRMTPQQERMEIPPLKIFIPPKLQQIHNISISNDGANTSQSENRKTGLLSFTGREKKYGMFSEKYSDRLKKHIKKKKDFLREIIRKDYDEKKTFGSVEEEEISKSGDRMIKSLNSMNSYTFGKGVNMDLPTEYLDESKEGVDVRK